jgi:hypothetical protein
VTSGDKERLTIMERHGQDLLGFINEEDNCNTLLHYSVKANEREIVEHLLIRGALVNY